MRYFELNDKYTTLLEAQPLKDRCLHEVTRLAQKLDTYKLLLGDVKRRSQSLNEYTILNDLLQKVSLAMVNKGTVDERDQLILKYLY